MVLTISKYHYTRHISHIGYTLSSNHEGLPIMTFSLPSTKSASQGEAIYCAPQAHSFNIDPKSVLHNHFCINLDAPLAHLFS